MAQLGQQHLALHAEALSEFRATYSRDLVDMKADLAKRIKVQAQRLSEHEQWLQLTEPQMQEL